MFSAAHNAVEDSKADYISELKYARKDSFLEGLDSVNIDVEFQRTAENSVAYMILERMEIDADDYFTFEDFPHIMDFNTPDTLSLLGNAVSSISEQALREIAATIRAEIKKDRKIFAKSENTKYNIDKDKNNIVEERTDNNVREHNLQTGGRLSNSRPQTAAGGQTDRQIRKNEGEISETEQEQQLHNDAADGNTERASGGNRQDSNRTGGENSVADGESGGRERGTESRRPDEVDTADEQPQTFSGRNRVSGNSTQLSLFDLLIPTEEEQQNIIREAERLTFGSAFSMPQQIIDEVLTSGANNKDSILNICTEYSKDKSSAENIAFLKNEYGTGGKGFIFDGNKVSVWWNDDGIKIAYGDSAVTSNLGELITWEKADSRIKELLELGRYAPQETLDKISEFEYKKAARTFYEMYRCINTDKHPELLEHFHTEWFSNSFPDTVDRISELFKQTENIDLAINAVDEVRSLYNDDKSVVAYRVYAPDKVLSLLHDLQRQHITFTANEYQTSNAARFITEDEIDRLLTDGSGMEQGKIRIYLYFKEHTNTNERIEFLKNEYGIGGHSGGIFDEGHDAKGITFSRDDILSPLAKVNISWNTAAKRIDSLIKSNRYLTEREIAEDIPKYLSAQEQLRIQSEKRQFLDNIRKNGTPQERQQAIPKRLLYYIDTIDLSDKNIFNEFNLSEILDANEIKIAELIKNPEKRQQIIDCLEYMQTYAVTMDARSNAYLIAIDLKELQFINLHKVGDFYEIYGEEAEKAAEILDITLTPKTVDGERLPMVGFPAHIVEDYSKTLTESGYFIVFTEDEKEENISDIIAEMTDEEKEAYISGTELTIDYGEGTTLSDEEFAVYEALIKERSEAEEQSKFPQQEKTVEKAFYEYALTIVSRVVNDESYINACLNSDKETAKLECDAAVKRAVSDLFTTGKTEVYKMYFDMPEFQEKIHTYSFEQTYDIIRENEMDAPITDEPQQEQTEDYSQYIGREIIDDDRKFIVDSINETAETVSLRDITCVRS